MAPRKCSQGRRPVPFCLPSRPYSEWPSVQLLEECARRGIRVIRKGPSSNASKVRLALILRQSDAERAAAVAKVTGEQLAGDEDSVSVAALNNEPELHSSSMTGDAVVDGESIPTTDDSDEAATEQESQEPDEEHETPLNSEGTSPRKEQGEQAASEGRELNEEQQQRATNAEYNAAFRLVNVLFSRFASRFDELMRGTIEHTDRIAKRRLWIDVSDSFHSSAPEFSTLINDHAMFADIDPSFPRQQRVQSRRAIVRVWKSLSATYSRALQQARQVNANDAQFYVVCGGRLDVLYLHLWLLLKPQLAIHFASESPGQTHSNNESSHDRPTKRTRPPTTTEKPSLLNQAQATNSSKSSLKRKRVEKNSDSSLDIQQTSTSNFPDAQTDPALYAEYMKLKLEVLREKKALLAASAAREQMQFLEVRRRGLLRDVSELSITVDDLQQRLVQSTTTATNQSDADQGASPTTHTRITRQTTAESGAVAVPDSAAVAELKQNLALFSRQKRQRVADVARCDQQIQELGVRLFGSE